MADGPIGWGRPQSLRGFWNRIFFAGFTPEVAALGAGKKVAAFFPIFFCLPPIYYFSCILSTEKFIYHN
jgi:hypothetical protein